MIDEGFNLGLKVTRQEGVFQKDAAPQDLVPTLNLSLCPG
uniref:Uncharacterized protein n=1 Tax=alpha proteobacterium U95 TaxID=649539 RepID=M4VNI8_9PROT|nr:hypothetical protein [alpha proteobacterium U95]